MINNIQSFKSKVRQLAIETGLSHNQIIQSFMFEKFLDRLSISPYKDNFIIKGGCLLSSIMGIDMRTTMDIDTNITGVSFSFKNIKNIVNEIINIKLNDNILFDIQSIEDIKETQDYNGYRFTILCKFSNIKCIFHLDISTGDIITPKAIEYSYKKILENETISLMAYNCETIIAEKMQSILHKKINNSRMKDFYDIYYLSHYRWKELNYDDLKNAINNTFNHRKTYEDILRKDEILDKIENDPLINTF